MADKKGADGKQRRLRSRDWFDAPGDPTMAALYLERYLNFGLTLAELHSNRPIIGIAQTGSDLSPCNRHHLHLAERVRDGIRDSGGIRSEEHTSELQSQSNIVCRLLLEKKKQQQPKQRPGSEP